MAAPDKPLVVLHHVDSMAAWCERQATELDPLIRASGSGRPLSPYETRQVLLGVQELYRRVGQSNIFLAYFVPKWVWLGALLAWRRKKRRRAQ